MTQAAMEMFSVKMCCVAGIFVQLGFSFVYLLGSVTHWTTAAGISAAVPIAAVIAISQVNRPDW
jgi:hypothetical protein